MIMRFKTGLIKTKKSLKTKSKKSKDNKYTLNWDFKKFLLEDLSTDKTLDEVLQEFEEVKIQGIVYIDGESELMKSQIISHIRAIVRYYSC